MSPRRRRLLLAGTSALVAAALLAVAVWHLAAGGPSTQLSPAATTALAADGMTPLGGRPAPGFQLVDQTGQPLSLRQLQGRVVILSFLDPVCWLECPLQAQEMAAVDRLLGPRLAGRVALVAVNSNPLYHSLADVRAFDRQENLNQIPNWSFLTSTSVPALQQVWREYGNQVSVPKNGMVDHSLLFYLIDAQGREQYVSIPQAEPGYVWGTSQLLATYVLRMLGVPGPLASTAHSALPATAQAEPIGAAGPVEVRLTPSGRGWMVVNAAPYQVVETTADAGAHWSDVGPPGISKRGGLDWSWSGPSAAWVAVRPFGWMLDTSVYRTTSAGSTWGTPAVLSGAPVAGAVAPLAGDGSERAGILLSSGLWTTGDGGAAWQRAAALPAAVSRAGLTWAPTGAVWLSGQVTTGGTARLWTLVPGNGATTGGSPAGSAAGAQGSDSAAGGGGSTAAGGSTVAGGGSGAAGGGSTAAGASVGARGAWRAVDLPVPSGMRGLQLVTLPPVWSGPLQAGAAVVAVDGTRQWLWWATTSDGGRRWHVALPPVAVEGALSQGAVDAPGDGSVYALGAVPGGTAVWRGDLARGTWSQVGSPLPAAPGRAVDFPDAADGWVVAGGASGGGGAAHLWQTANGGRTWQQVRVPAPAS